MTIGLVVPADRPVPAAAAPQGNGRFVGAVETPHAYVTGSTPITMQTRPTGSSTWAGMPAKSAGPGPEDGSTV
ncbi:hypothetical protein ACFQ6C_27950 [Streptomyces sp. NPDC056454]|uniref:hypothetical protein n=1 Tax=Streptomyces sp. NPDC056454 TaxID=3345823 RepID=UPI0036C357D1